MMVLTLLIGLHLKKVNNFGTYSDTGRALALSCYNSFISKRPYAVFTITHNESVYLPIWLSYYSKYFESQDIYVLDHDSTDGSIERARQQYSFNCVKVHHDGVYNNQFIISTMIGAQRELLERYNLVICSDTDELIMADPITWPSLNAYLDNFSHDIIACNSRSIQQQRTEPAIDLTKGILSQRSVWFSEPNYNKVVVTRVPIIWNSGYGAIDNSGVPYDIPIDNELVLLHMARMDFDICRARHERLSDEKWDNEPGAAIQHTYQGETLESWFYSEADRPIAKAPKGKLESKKYIAVDEPRLMEHIPKRFENLR